MTEHITDNGTGDDDFDAAFDEFSAGKGAAETGDDEGSAADVAGGDMGAAAGDPAGDGGSDAGQAAGAAAEDSGAGAAPDAAESGVPAEQSQSQAPDMAGLLAKIEALQNEITDLRAKPADAPATSAPADPPPEDKPFYTAEEQSAIDNYKKDWEDVHKGEALIRKQEYNMLVNYVFDQVYSHFQPLLDYMGERTDKDHYSDLKSRINDYDQVRDDAIAWIDTQPKILQASYRNVVEKGTVEEVQEFIDLYKQSPQYTQKVAAKPAAPVSPKPDVAAAAKKLGVVTSGRTSQTSAPDPNDFDAAFDEFASRTGTK